MSTAPLAEICHLFVFIDDLERAAEKMARLGFQESYRRNHPGQGTENVCYCFDNLYLELLYATRKEELISPAVKPLQFDKRHQWANTGTSPFGIALRAHQAFPFDAHLYMAPYLPKGMSIAYSKSSDDLHHPFLFLSPGSKRPDQWDNKPQRQTEAGFSEVRSITLTLPTSIDVHPDLFSLAENGLLHIEKGQTHRLHLTLSNLEGKDVSILCLPSFVISPL